jgi:maltooligosyltrehalose trehalohydrolase
MPPAEELATPTMAAQHVPLGATYLGADRTRFCVWAPLRRRVEVHLHAPDDRVLPLEPAENGYFTGTFDGVPPLRLYTYRLDGQLERPDPASRAQPEGVHGPSQVIDQAFVWADAAWKGLPLNEYILYEIHVGTFTPKGTFAAAITRLDDLKDLGVTAVELMPVAQFPGTRNWGYDGVYPFAVQDSYGGPAGLKQFVDACHGRGLAVVLDVVYNHLGPEGNYLADFAPYYTDRYRTPWGPALNFDGRHSDEVRRFFFENALGWQTEFHLDGLRLDAIHAMKDFSARPVLQELAAVTAARAADLGRPIYLIAESNLNDPRVVQPPDAGGYGLDAQWSDDFHHALHALLTGERQGYYEDFGDALTLARACRDGFTFTGEYSCYRGRRHGRPARDLPAWRHVVYGQNHDQVGNRMRGERLSELVNFERLKLSAAAVLLSPFVPLLFMGEEYGETAPFPYFVSHGDPALVEAVRQGRRREFVRFRWPGEPPDPQDELTFQSARLRHELAHTGHHRVLRDFYRELIRLRKAVSALAHLSKDHLEDCTAEGPALLLRRWSSDGDEVFLVLNFGAAPARVSTPAGQWRKLLDSALPRWLGPGSSVDENLIASSAVTFSVAPESCVLFQRRAASP